MQDGTVFAVNDNPDVEHANGGSHWSLAVLVEDTLLHADSHGMSNHNVAQRLLSALACALGKPGIQLEEVECAQQSNCYDCGMHLLGTVEGDTRM